MIVPMSYYYKRLADIQQKTQILCRSEVGFFQTIIHSTSPIVIGIAKLLPMVSGIIGAGLLSTLSLSIFRLTRLRLLRVVLSPVITSLPSFDPISPFTYFFTLPINLFLFPLG